MAKPFKVGDIIRGVELLELDEEKTTKKEKYWKCKCPTCGEIYSFRSGHVGNQCASCGAKQRRSKRITSCVIDDLTGREFGYLLVLGKAPKSNFWHCKCQLCGTEKDIFRGSLINGDSKSCGCMKSWGETQLIYLLSKYHLSYKREISFPDLLGTKGGHLRFDFGIYQGDKLQCLIEYDGQQHYEYSGNWHNEEEKFIQLQIHDNMKNEYCKRNNILLYRLNNKSNIEDIVKQISMGE